MDLLGLVNTYDNVFDIYIILFGLIKNKQSDILAKSEQNHNVLCKMMKEIYNLFKGNNVTYIISEKDKKLLQIGISELCKEDEEICALALFIQIDEYFGNREYRFDKSFKVEDFDIEDIEDDGSKVRELRILNTDKTSSIGKVFYKTESIFDEIFEGCNYPRTDDRKGRSLERYQDNLTVIPKRLSEIKVKFLGVNCEYTITQLKKKKQNLRIAMIPFVNDLKYLDTYDEDIFFYIRGVNDEDKALEHLESLMKKLNEEQVDIIVFPEMVFTSRMEKWLEEYLKKNKTSFILIISGSKWENKSNKTRVYNGNGFILNEQIKINPYHITGKENQAGDTEGIVVRSEEAEVRLLDIESLGRVSTPICVDFTIDEYFNSLKDSGVNVSFNPACTGSLHDFHANAEKLGSANRGVVFVSNSCMHQGKEEIGFVYIPIKFDKEVDAIPSELSFKRCGTNEVSTCKCLDRNCYFLIKFGARYCRTETIRI